MHPNLQTMLLAFIIIIIIINIQIPTYLCNPDEQYTNCNALFQCGNLQGVGYPFWGLNRPDYCGVPGFLLDCSGQTPSITIKQLKYQVLDINNASQTLKVARTDYTENICPSFFVNSIFYPSPFSYTSNTQNIMLYYGCPMIASQFSTPGLSKPFTCTVNGTEIVGYYLTRNLTSSSLSTFASNISSYLGSCNHSVIVPAYQSAVQSIESSPTAANLIMALNYGFGLQWIADNASCEKCKISGGRCGYSRSTSNFTCYCHDRPYALVCHRKGISHPEWRRKMFLVLGTLVYTTIAVCLIVIFFTRSGRLTGTKIMTMWKKDENHDRKIETFIMNYHSLTPRRFSYPEIKKITNSFTDKLGQGGFGSVYKGKLLDGRLVAVKVLNKSKADGEEFINEVASISRTAHVNIVTLLGFCYDRSRRALIYEYMPNGSLDKFIYRENSRHPDRKLEWRALYEIAVGIARGLEYLHRGCNTRIVHFDIKPHNILLNENFCPKISDFGLAKLHKGEESKVSMTGARGTAGYIAPEIFCRNIGGVSYKSDVYSYGMMVLEMVGGRENIDVEESDTSEVYFPDYIYKHLEAGKVSKLNGVITNEEAETARKMILVGLWCIQINPSDRPSMTKVVEMLEGSLQFLQTPPKPFSSSPTMSP